MLHHHGWDTCYLGSSSVSGTANVLLEIIPLFEQDVLYSLTHKFMSGLRTVLLLNFFCSLSVGIINLALFLSLLLALFIIILTHLI